MTDPLSTPRPASLPTIRQYLQSLASGHLSFRRARALADAVGAAAQRVDANSRGDGIVHGDLVAANLLEGSALWLLDWEYAQFADPVWHLYVIRHERAGVKNCAAGRGSARPAVARAFRVVRSLHVAAFYQHDQSTGYLCRI